MFCVFFYALSLFFLFLVVHYAVHVYTFVPQYSLVVEHSREKAEGCFGGGGGGAFVLKPECHGIESHPSQANEKDTYADIIYLASVALDFTMYCMTCPLLFSTHVSRSPAPKSTCSAMQYIQSTVSRLFTLSCYFPHENNCSVLTCPFGDGMDLTVSILRCAHPPAIRITYGNGFFNLFDHTFDHSEVVPIQLQGAPNNTVLNVTLDQLCPSDIGLQVSLLWFTVEPF